MYNSPRMPTDFDRMLRTYAELTVKIGLNLQPRQRLLIIGPVANGGCSLEAAPLVRQITAAACDAGAQLVETLWGDEALLGARLQHAPHDSFGEFSAWLPHALVQHVEAGHAVLSIYANDPDQLKVPGRSTLRPCSRRRRAAFARSASTFPATRPTGVSSPPPRRRGPRGVSGPAGCRTDDRAVERDRAVVPARSSRSDRGLGDAPRRTRGAHRII